MQGTHSVHSSTYAELITADKARMYIRPRFDQKTVSRAKSVVSCALCAVHSFCKSFCIDLIRMTLEGKCFIAGSIATANSFTI